MSDKLQQARDAIEADDKKTGQQLLAQLIKANPRHVKAWLLLAQTVDDDDKRRQCYQRALDINPHSFEAREALGIRPPNGEPRAKTTGTQDGMKVLLIILGMILAFLVTYVICGGGAGGGSSRPQHSARTAAVMCREFVKDELKSPSTAKFPSEERNSAPWEGKPDGYYEVMAAVDAENSFGVLMRTRYLCQIHYAGDDNWALDALVFLD